MRSGKLSIKITGKFKRNNYSFTYPIRKNAKSVCQYDKYGFLLKKYYSISQASLLTGICQSGISSTCLGKQKMSGGYLWCFNQF